VGDHRGRGDPGAPAACDIPARDTAGAGHGARRARIINTLIGGTLALLAARFLWPISERDLFPTSARAALVAARDHLALVITNQDAHPRAQARSEVGLALLNAETSLNRWLSEVRRRASDLEAPATHIAHVRHLSATTPALGELAPPDQCRADAPFFAAVATTLDDIVACVDERRAPPALPPLESLATSARGA